MGACCEPSLIKRQDPKPPILVCDLKPVRYESLFISVTGISGIHMHSDTIEKIHVSKSGYYVEIAMLKHNPPASDMGNYQALLREKVATIPAPALNGKASISSLLQLHVIDVKDKLCVSVHAAYARSAISEGYSKLIGETTISIEELITRPKWDLWMVDKFTEVVVFDRSGTVPLSVQLEIDTSQYPDKWSIPRSVTYEGFSRHLMVLTRGTRGDVQPFIALARGLAETYNFMITIVTEISHKDLVKQFSTGLKRGCIRFRPSGGNTQARVDTPIAKWAVSNRSRFLQVAMLARSEREFFDSEPAMYHWAKTVSFVFVRYAFVNSFDET